MSVQTQQQQQSKAHLAPGKWVSYAYTGSSMAALTDTVDRIARSIWPGYIRTLFNQPDLKGNDYSYGIYEHAHAKKLLEKFGVLHELDDSMMQFTYVPGERIVDFCYASSFSYPNTAKWKAAIETYQEPGGRWKMFIPYDRRTSGVILH